MANRAQRVIEGLVARGFSPVQAAVLAGNINVESGFNPEAYNPKEDAYGGLQWRLDRKKGLEDYAKSTGRKPSDPEAQMDWLVMEMTGPEAKNAAGFLAAQDPYSANLELKKFIRYAPGTENARLSHALSYMGGDNALTGEPMQVAEAGPLFVNPAFGGAEMPGAPQWTGSQYALPADGQPAPSLSPTNTGAPQVGSQPVSGPSDDDLLQMFMASPGSEAAAVPGPAANDDDESLLRAFMPTTPGTGDTAVAPAGLTPGSKAYADWAVEQARAGKRLPQVSEVPEDQRPPPTGLMDKAGAAAASYMEGMPVLGPAWLDAAEKARAAVQGIPLDVVKAETQAAQAANPLTSGVAGVAGTVVPFLGAGLTGLGGKLLGVSGSIPQQIAMGGLSNAAIAGADTLARGGDVEQARSNALLGGVIGGAAPAVLGVAGKVGNMLLGQTSPEVAQLAETAIDKYGIPVGPGQITESPMVKFADSVVNKLPFSGGTVSNAQQAGAFNRAVANTFGENAEKITPDVMAKASARIGQAFEDVATNTPRIASDPTFDQGILDVMTNAQMALTDQQMAPLARQFDNIIGKFQQGNGAISGKVYQELTKKGAPLWDAMHSADPGVRTYASRLRDVLDDALERSASPQVLAQLKEARSQWKAMRTIEDLVEKAPTGDINPALLMGAVRSSYDNMAYGGGGDLAELARIGQQFLKAPPSSGSAERLAIMNALTKLGGAGGLAATALMNPGSIPMMATIGVPTAAGYLGLAKGAGAALRSEALANKLIGNSLGVAPNVNRIGAPNLLLRGATGNSAVDKKVPLSIVVRGGNNNALMAP